MIEIVHVGQKTGVNDYNNLGHPGGLLLGPLPDSRAALHLGILDTPKKTKTI